MEERELQENEDKKEYLKSYIPKERAARRLEKEIEDLRLSKQSPVLICDGMPHGTDKTDLSAYMVRLDELERKLIKAHAERVNVYTSIFLDIEKLEDEREKELLTLRYLKGMKWEDICVIMGYSWKHIHRLHASALKNFKMA